MAKTEKKTAPRAVELKRTAAASTGIDVGALDATQDGTRPDTSADALCVHAETLATHVRLHEARLKLAKITPGTADRLEALAALLRTHQTSWATARSAVSADDLAGARADAVEARGDLFAALRFFAPHRPKVQRALDAVAEGTGDADTLQDIHTLLELADTNSDVLEGTDMPSERVAQVKARGEKFRVLLARSEAKSGGDSDDEGAAGQGALSHDARAALGLRNRVFWALSALDRHACGCGKYAFRKEPAVAGLFGAYLQRAPKKPQP